MFINFTTVAADLVILAVNTRKVTTAEEHIANTILAIYCRFFAMMNGNGTDIEPGIASANTNFSIQPVNITIARTNAARNQRFK